MFKRTTAHRSGTEDVPARVTQASTFLLLLSVLCLRCVNHEYPRSIDCAASELVIELITASNPVQCDRASGSIEVAAAGGTSPYQYSLGSDPFGSVSFFSNLSAGMFIVTVRDSRGCERQLTGISLVTPDGPTAEVTSMAHSDCLSPNGSITLTVAGGTSPYQYKINDGGFTHAATFSGLTGGKYTITIRDAAECTTEINEIIDRDTGVSYKTDIEPILLANCIKSGCHNGDNGADRDWRFFANVKNKAQSIRARTAEKTMPPGDLTSLTENEIAMIACWADDGAKNN